MTLLNFLWAKKRDILDKVDKVSKTPQQSMKRTGPFRNALIILVWTFHLAIEVNNECLTHVIPERVLCLYEFCSVGWC